MCLLVCLAASAPLDLVPYVDGALLSIDELHEDDAAVRAHFSKPFVYDVSAYEGCGCGFKYGQPGQEPNVSARAQESTRVLADYLARAVDRTGPLELYACWMGEQTWPVEVRAELRVGEMGAGDAFELVQRMLYSVTR